MTAGAGLYTIGGLGTAVMLVTLAVLREIERDIPRRIVDSWSLEVTFPEGVGSGTIRAAIEASCGSVTLDRLHYDTTTHVMFSADLAHRYAIDVLTQELRAAGATSISWQAHETEVNERGV